jgi:hypothetical protein
VAGLSVPAWLMTLRSERSWSIGQEAMRVLVRYCLGYTLILYGTVKIGHGQFLVPMPGRLLEPLGQVSLMGLLWTFMGAH